MDSDPHSGQTVTDAPAAHPAGTPPPPFPLPTRGIVNLPLDALGGPRRAGGGTRRLRGDPPAENRVERRRRLGHGSQLRRRRPAIVCGRWAWRLRSATAPGFLTNPGTLVATTLLLSETLVFWFVPTTGRSGVRDRFPKALGKDADREEGKG